MEGLARLVSDSLARHGLDAPVDHRRLQWSSWFRCQSSFDLLLVPSEPGLLALAEAIAAPGELATATGKRMLAVLQISQADDVCLGLGRLFAPGNPLRERLSQGRCFARYVVIKDEGQRHSAVAELQNWLASSSETATAFSDLNLGREDTV